MIVLVHPTASTIMVALRTKTSAFALAAISSATNTRECTAWHQQTIVEKVALSESSTNRQSLLTLEFRALDVQQEGGHIEITCSLATTAHRVPLENFPMTSERCPRTSASTAQRESIRMTRWRVLQRARRVQLDGPAQEWEDHRCVRFALATCIRTRQARRRASPAHWESTSRCS